MHEHNVEIHVKKHNLDSIVSDESHIQEATPIKVHDGKPSPQKMSPGEINKSVVSQLSSTGYVVNNVYNHTISINPNDSILRPKTQPLNAKSQLQKKQEDYVREVRGMRTGEKHIIVDYAKQHFVKLYEPKPLI